MTDRKPPEQEYDEAPAVHSMADAPKDTFFVARDRAGDTAHIYWNSNPDFENDTEPYWARMDNDCEFEPVGWVPTSWSYDDTCKVYE